MGNDATILVIKNHYNDAFICYDLIVIIPNSLFAEWYSYITPPYSSAFLLTNLSKFPYTSPQNRSQFNQVLYSHYDL